MGAKKKSHVSPERRRWETTYNNLVHLLKTQQIQLETLLRERKLLERRIKTQHDRWSSLTKAAQDQIFQMKCDMAVEEDVCSLQRVTSDLMAGMAQREALRLKLMLDYAEGELAGDHKNFLEALQQKTSQSMELSEKGFKSGNKRSEVLESEIISLREEHDKLLLKKTAEVSALLLEKDFVWHQLKTLEDDYTDKLKRKTDEAEKASEKVANLIGRLEELQSSNDEKDKTIQALESKIAKMEADANSQRKDMSRVNYELRTLRKSINFVPSPSLRRCSTETTRSSRSGNQIKGELSNLANHSEKGSTGSKRKLIDIINIPDTPKLFSASFKAPKLKQTSLPSVNTSQQHGRH